MNAAWDRRVMEMLRGDPPKRNESNTATSGSSTMKLALWTKKIILVGEEESCGEEKTLVENRSKM